MTTSTGLCHVPATELARLIRTRAVSPVEVTRAVLERIERLNPQINAYCTITGWMPPRRVGRCREWPLCCRCAVFFAQGCYGCHRLGVAGTPIAHDLSHVGRKYSEADLARWLRDPAMQKPTAHMPRLALTEQEIRALAKYLASLR